MGLDPGLDFLDISDAMKLVEIEGTIDHWRWHVLGILRASLTMRQPVL